MKQSMVTNENSKRFEVMSFEVLNQQYQLNYVKTEEEVAQDSVDIERLTDSIEAKGLSYFYASYNEKDVLEAFKEEPAVNINHYRLIELSDNGLCLAILN